jgi:phosphate transport system substrate-binding protein
LPAAPLLAGSGAGLPALEMLAREYAAASGKSVRLGPSLGTSGGVRALADGAVDAAIASRKLAPAEAQGLEQVEFAVGELVLAAGRDVPDASIRVEDLRRLLAGDSVTWSDGGAAEFLLREPGDSGTQAFLRAYPDLAPAFEDAAETARWPVLVTDRSMEATLVSQGRAVGVFERQAIRVRALPLEVLHIVDAVPAEAASRPLTLLLRADASADVRQFAAFVCGPAAQALLARAGYAAGSCAGGGKP